MFTKSMFAAVVVAASAALSVPAFANGNDQLALSLGVAPGAYTFSQLIELNDAIRDNDQERVNFIKGEGIASRSAATSPTTEGAAQLALKVGVQPGTLSVDQLIRLQGAIYRNDAEAQRFILSGADRMATADDRGSVTPAKAQLAAVLNVDPAAYTTAELALQVGLLNNNLSGNN